LTTSAPQRLRQAPLAGQPALASLPISEIVVGPRRRKDMGDIAALAPVRQQQIRLDPLDVFVARAEAGALLWAAGEFDLHEAVDKLQADAVRDGLVERIGQDAVQRILADCFAAVRDDLGPATTINMVPDDRAAAPPKRVPRSTLDAAAFLVREGDAERLRKWLAKHSADERAVIHQHLQTGRRSHERRPARVGGTSI
jgi:hypothetical protein